MQHERVFTCACVHLRVCSPALLLAASHTSTLFNITCSASRKMLPQCDSSLASALLRLPAATLTFHHDYYHTDASCIALCTRLMPTPQHGGAAQRRPDAAHCSMT